jgi:hypothetical protein
MFMTAATYLMTKYFDIKVNNQNSMSNLGELDLNNVPSMSFDPLVF